MTETILAVLADRHGARACLEAAFAAAAELADAEVAALHVSVDPRTTILPTEEMMTDVRRREIERQEAGERHDLRAVFDAVSDDLGPFGFRWVDASGTETTGVTDAARAAVLLVMAVPPRHYAGEAQEAEHAALFDAGRPLLLVPQGYRHRPVERIVVAWHDDDPCRRAIRDAVPWLRRAAAVHVVSVDGGDAARLDPARDLLQSLDITASFEALDRGDHSKGECLLAAAAQADWLVMGAFRRGQLADWLIGSTTEVVIADLTLPVFFAH